MLKKTKIQIVVVVSLGVFLIGALFYFRAYSGKKKVQIDLSQNQEQKVAEESPSEQDATSDEANPPSLASSADELRRAEELQRGEAENNGANNQPDKNLKNTETTDKAGSVGDTELPKTTKLSITDRLVSWGFQKSSGRKIDTIIIHSSYDAMGDDPYSVSGVIKEYLSYGVSPHYLVDRKGNIYRLVLDQNIAYHAGESKMPDGRTGVNDFSIGIEVLTTQKDAPTSAQYSALKLLIADLKGKYKITSILGHIQIAPGRKGDPWNFDWNKLK